MAAFDPEIFDLVAEPLVSGREPDVSEAYAWLAEIAPDVASALGEPPYASLVCDRDLSAVLRRARRVTAVALAAGASAASARLMAYGAARTLSVGSYVSGHYCDQLSSRWEAVFRVQTVSLYNNHFTEVPKVVRTFEHLERLNLARNRLRTLPPWLFELPALELVVVGANPDLEGAVAEAIHRSSGRVRVSFEEDWPAGSRG
jgi:hypothetical protein